MLANRDPEDNQVRIRIQQDDDKAKGRFIQVPGGHHAEDERCSGDTMPSSYLHAKYGTLEPDYPDRGVPYPTGVSGGIPALELTAVNSRASE